MHNNAISADAALEKLKAGNAAYMDALICTGDISPAVREKTYREGQSPYAVIISCSDSRVIPESIFMAGIGELFVIRVAGNVMDKHQIGSVEYALEHLGCRLVVVLGHTCCGAVDAAVNHDPDGYIKFITDEILRAAAGETDGYKACRLNVEQSVRIIKESLNIFGGGEDAPKVLGAIYHVDDGKVEFI